MTKNIDPDRTVHASFADGSEITSYASTGQYFHEFADGRRPGLGLREAVAFIVAAEGQALTMTFHNNAGTRDFDRLLRKALRPPKTGYNKRRGLRKATATAIWKILAEHGGVEVDDYDHDLHARDSFVHTQNQGHVGEYRFSGNLGFGGKLYRTAPERNGRQWGLRESWIVTCYREDETPERRQAIVTMNDLLFELAIQHEGK